MALMAKKDNPNARIVVLGQLVHNHHVEEFLAKKGIICLSGAIGLGMLGQLRRHDIAIFTAHGHDQRYEEYLRALNVTYYDATCPFVKVAHQKIINEIIKGHQVIYIGKMNHPETLAALAISKEVHLYRPDFNYEIIKDESPLIINQTTLNIKEIEQDYIKILEHIPKARIEKEICNTTRLRQEALINLSQNVDVIYVVGDAYSSNTSRLMEIANSYHPNSKNVLISDIKDINLEEIKNKKYLAIVSGASTPSEFISEIYTYLKNNLR